MHQTSLRGYWFTRILVVASLQTLLPYVSTVSINENWEKIIERYVSLCGDDHFICNKDQIASKSPTENNKLNISCPICSCDYLCRINGNCCPDVSLNTCVQTSFDQATSENSEWLFMTNDCPQDAEERLVKQCQQANTDENVLKRVPVTSTQTNMTYSNIQCAKCNRETTSVPWMIESDCKVDTMSFTNVANLWENMKKKHCNIHYIPPWENFPLPEKCIRDNNLIDRCNISGLLSTSDESLELACKSTLQPIGLFKNVFCLLCNIQDNAFDPPISTCNVTGKLGHLDEQVEYKCLNQSVDLMKYPYKNEFCEECNLVKTDDGHYHYSDVNLTISVYNRFQNVSGIRNISKHMYVSEFKVHSLNFSLDPSLGNYNDNITSGLNNTARHFKKTQDFRPDFSWFIKDKWCSRVKSRYLEENSISMKTCSCTEQCYAMNTCCKDPDDVYTMRQIRIWGCVRMSVPRSISTNGPTYFVISKCPDDYQNDVIRSQCESDTGDNFLSYLPVTDMRESITYKNYYCFLCVSPPPQKFDPNDQPVPWRVSLQCPIPFNFENETNLESILKQGLAIQCTFYFAPNIPQSAPVPCQNHVHASLYCSLCVSFFHENFDDRNVIYVGKTYRSIFSLYDNTDETVHTNINKFEVCSKDQILDRWKGKCRNLTCCAGKVLSNGECKSIISSNLPKIYNIAFRAGIMAGDLKRPVDKNLFVQEIIQFVTEDLYYDTNVEVSPMKYYIRANCSCSEMMEKSKLNQVWVRIFMKISIQNKNSAVLLNTDLIEQILFNVTSKTRFLGNLSIEGHEDVRAWFLPLSKKPIQSIPFCDIRDQFLSSSSDINEPGTDINKLLFCPQVSLSPDEFSTSSDGLHVFVESINRTFYYNEFSRGVYGTVQICVNEYMNMGNTVSPFSLKDQIPGRPFSLALFILSALTTAVSLLSLLVTFVVYCILQKLRTIPGQNLMCFVGSLFFAQLLSLLKDIFNVHKMACAAVGILTYYFWLAVFTCANVCCFHMLRVFVCNTRFQDKYVCSRSLVWYIIYAFSLPLIFCIVTIGCHVTLSPVQGSGFGGQTCFIDDRQTQLFSFILPISAICLVNFVLFTITFYKIYSAPTMENTNLHSRNDLTIYFKLFLLTGTAWVFQIIDGLFAVSPFSYLVTILIASQGLYIMISFVFNRRVKYMLQEIGFYEKIHFFIIQKTSSSGSTQMTQKITNFSDHSS